MPFTETSVWIFAGGFSGSLLFYKLGSHIIYGSQWSDNQLLSRPLTSSMPYSFISFSCSSFVNRYTQSETP